jgi:hypothetical protein
MNREVHFDFTMRWARQEGFSAEDARIVGSANWACDVRHTGLSGKRYHWPLAGAPILSWHRFRTAVAQGDLVLLGEALHALQDTIGHGLIGHLYHWKGIDRWEHRSPRIRRRLETASRRMLAAYLAQRRARGAREDDGSRTTGDDRGADALGC